MNAKVLSGCLLIGAAFAPGIRAQTVPVVSDEVARAVLTPRYAIMLESNDWLSSDNPAAIGVVTMPETGSTRIGGNHLGGDFRRAQQSGSITSWGFSSESYRSLKGLNLYGSFEFTQQRHRDRRYSDNLDPYNGNPFVAGSDIAGEYTNQIFDFDVAVSSLKLADMFYLGAAADFTVGDFSRLQDPRSRSQYIDYTFRPGGIFETGSHRLGANFKYRYSKEKLGTYSIKSQSTPDEKFSLYLQEGLGVYEKKIATYFDRRIKGHYLGGELQYGYTGGRLTLLAGADYLQRKDDVEDKQLATPGDYVSSAAGGFLRVRLHGRQGAMQVLNLTARICDGTAHKAFQEMRSQTHPQTGVTTSYYATLFTEASLHNSTTDVSADWTYYRLSGDGYKWYAGLDASYSSLSERYVSYVPASRIEASSAGVSLRGGYTVFDRNRRSLNITASGGGLFNIQGDVSISSELPADRQTIVTDVVMPDYAYLTSDAVVIGLELQYAFPFLKQRKQQGYFAVYFTDYFSEGKSRYVAGLSLGILMDRR